MKSVILLPAVFSCCFAIGQNIPHPNITGPMGMEINTYTGNLFYQRTDLTLKGTGFPVYGSFYYNSAMDSLNAGYGYGWNFYYDMAYEVRDTTVTIIRSDARTDAYQLQPNGTYKAPTGIFDVLTKSGTEYILTTKEGMKHYFSNPSNRRLTRMADPNNNSITIEYASGVIFKIRNNSGRCMVLGWSNGNLETMVDSALPAKKYTYHYDSNRDLISVTNPLNATTGFTYTNHDMTRLADEKNNPVVIGYKQPKVVSTVNSCNSRITISITETPSFGFIAASSGLNSATVGNIVNQASFTTLVPLRKAVVTKDATAGNETMIYDYDNRGNLSTVTNPDRKQALFGYDRDKNLVQFTDWNGFSTSYTYDAKGNLLTQTDARGNRLTYTYEPIYNKLTSVRDQRGQTYNLVYDAAGNLSSTISPGGITENYSYDAAGNLQTYQNARNQTTTFQYNTNNDLVKIIYPIGEQRFEYNGSCCNLGRITDANGNTLTMTYDLLNQVTSIKDDLNNTLTNNYDAAGNLANETDANGNVKNYGYDQENRLKSVFLPSAGLWTYFYDGADNLTGIHDANGNYTSYGYTKNNWLSTEKDPLGNTTRYTYDANGNVTAKAYPNGNTITYKYDELNRLIQKDYPGNSDKYSYDAAGNLTSAYNNNITYTFQYDVLNRLIKKNIVNWGKSISYTYDSAGNRKTMTDNDGLPYTYTYDGNNRLTILKNGYNLTTYFDYDAGGRLIKQTNANNTYTTYHYDAAGRLDSIWNRRTAGTDISFFYYTFDRMGNRKTMQDKRGLHTYGYDSSYRLTNVQYADGSTESFKIDPTGNRKEQTKNGVTTTYTYNAADQLQTAGTSSFTYDTNGNTTQQADSVVKNYSFDGESKLVQATINATKTVQWLYDPFGDKIARIDTNGVITRMIYDGDNLLAELDNSNNTIVKYTTALGIDSWISMNRGGSNYFYQKDGLNSTTELTDNTGQLVNEYGYDVYGTITSKSESVNNGVLYTGRIWERSTGLYDYRSRFYNAKNGKFITKDSYNGDLNNSLSVNHYNYVQNNPVNMIDPKGKFLVIAAPILIGAIWGANFELITQEIGYFQGKRKKICWNSVYRAAALGAVGGPIFKSVITQIGLGGLIYGPISNEALVQVGGRSAIVGGIYWAGNQLGGLGVKQTIKKVTNQLGDFSNELNCYEPPNQPGNQQPSKPKKPNPDSTEVLTPVDPNEIIGTDGYGDAKWVSYKDKLPYRIHFSNDPENATAPAKRVAIYMPIDAKLNPNSLRLGDFGFGAFTFSVPDNVATYSKRLDVRDSLGVLVDVTAGLDIPNRRAFWLFESIDPATGTAATLPITAGFLPVNDTLTHKGEGYVTLTIQPADDVHTADTTSVYAAILFDAEDTVTTNRWRNTVDAGLPFSRMSTLPTASNTNFRLSWSGQDDSLGSGIKHYDIYYSRNGGEKVLLRDKIDSTGMNFPGGDVGATYAFYSIATDNTGNREAPKTSGETSTTVIPQFNTICPGSSVTFSIPPYSTGYTYKWQVNTGAGFTDITDNSIYSGSGTATLTLSGAPSSWYGYQYRVVAINGSTTINSNTWTLKFSNTWKGTVSTAWENPANWNCNQIPDEYTDVVISSGAPHAPRLNSNGVCRSLTLSNGAAFTVSAGYNLDVKGK